MIFPRSHRWSGGLCLTAALAVLALAAPSLAIACAPDRGEGSRREINAGVAGEQRMAFWAARRILLVRVTETVDVTFDGEMGGYGRRAVLEPLGVIVGASQEEPVTLYMEERLCRALPVPQVFYAEPGELHVLFFRDETFTEDSLFASVKQADLRSEKLENDVRRILEDSSESE